MDTPNEVQHININSILRSDLWCTILSEEFSQLHGHYIDVDTIKQFAIDGIITESMITTIMWKISRQAYSRDDCKFIFRGIPTRI